MKDIIQMELSKSGYDFDGNLLTENTLNAGVRVMWKDDVYVTGNRKNRMVEIYRDNKFFRTVHSKTIKLIK